MTQRAAVIDQPDQIKKFAASTLAYCCRCKAKGVMITRALPTVKEIRRRYPKVTAKTYKDAAAQLEEHYT